MLERLESECPVVVSSAVNEDESELVPADRNAVTKCNINMNDIEIPGGKSVNCLAKCCLWDSCIVLGACWGTEELGWNESFEKKLRDVR